MAHYWLNTLKDIAELLLMCWELRAPGYFPTSVQQGRVYILKTYICMCIYVCVCVCISVCVYVCMCVYMYVYVCVYIGTYLYIHIRRCKPLALSWLH